MGTRERRSVVDGGSVAAGSPDRHGGTPSAPPRVLLVSSSGGVLTDLLGMRPWWERLDRRWVAVSAADTRELLEGESVDWAEDVAPSQPHQMAVAVLAADRDLCRRPVDLVISAGTAVAVPYFLAARRHGVNSWWVETCNLVGAPGRAARVCAQLATRTLVQREDLLEDRHRSVVVGELS